MGNPIDNAVGLRSEPFAKEVLAASLSYEGKPAFNHKEVLSCGSGPTQPSCMEMGLGPHSLDCSGLVVRAICDVLDIDISNWPIDVRHVRQMGDEAIPLNTPVKAGTLVITSRPEFIDGEKKRTPAHIGIAINARHKLHARVPRVERGLLAPSDPRNYYLLDPTVLARKVLKTN